MVSRSCTRSRRTIKTRHILSVKISMGGPFAEHPVRLAAAAGAAEENVEHRARQQRRLRLRLRLPPDRVRGGGCLAIRHQCFSLLPARIPSVGILSNKNKFASFAPRPPDEFGFPLDPTRFLQN